MVLGLSANRINYQFSELYDEDLIAKEWGFLTSSDRKNVKPFSNKEDVLDYWRHVYCIENKVDTE
ncbi:MAG: hypothetical protein COA38_10130 [Fluviicola sp.]|nr:MAG: hypothetical protein COA38_10130 [Fluviicola sp.]